jgi:hypothetical protein
VLGAAVRVSGSSAALASARLTAPIVKAASGGSAMRWKSRAAPIMPTVRSRALEKARRLGGRSNSREKTKAPYLLGLGLELGLRLGLGLIKVRVRREKTKAPYVSSGVGASWKMKTA